jgi:antirestriction protein ArdC
MQAIYQQVTDAILAALQSGTVPWRKDWTSTDTGIPMNAISGHKYRGVNVPLLWLAQQRNNWPTLRFLTYKQARESGGQVRGGSKSIPIVFAKPMEIEDKATGEKRTIHLLRGYRVFSVEQCDGLPEAIANPKLDRKIINPDKPNKEIDAFVDATGITIIKNKNYNPCYRPALDRVEMPTFKQFESAHAFYAAEMHEVSHATGHASRCNRVVSAERSKYAFEELVAELGASFLCAEFGIDHSKGAASYLDHWLKLLKADAKAFVKAATLAQQSCDWLRGRALQEPQAEAA